MKLTYSQIDELNNCYVQIPLNGNSILDAAINIITLKPHIDTILTIKSKLIQKYNNGKENISTSHKNWQKFVDEFNENLNKQVEVGELTKLKKTDLDLTKKTDTNLQSFIAALMNYKLLE